MLYRRGDFVLGVRFRRGIVSGGILSVPRIRRTDAGCRRIAQTNSIIPFCCSRASRGSKWIDVFISERNKCKHSVKARVSPAESEQIYLCDDCRSTGWRNRTITNRLCWRITTFHTYPTLNLYSVCFEWFQYLPPCTFMFFVSVPYDGSFCACVTPCELYSTIKPWETMTTSC